MNSSLRKLDYAIRKAEEDVNRAGGWLQLRKNTTPAHWLVGIMCAYVAYRFGIMQSAFLLIGTFWLWERWNDRELEKAQRIRKELGLPLKEVYTPQGAMDSWESYMMWMVGLGVLFLLDGLDKIVLQWL